MSGRRLLDRHQHLTFSSDHRIRDLTLNRNSHQRRRP
jgi:hypothetical protein